VLIGNQGTKPPKLAWFDMPADIAHDDEEEVAADFVGSGFTCHDDKVIADLVDKGLVADSGRRHNGRVVWTLTPLGRLAVADEQTMTRH
jgi:hypothetical protein